MDFTQRQVVMNGFGWRILEINPAQALVTEVNFVEPVGGCGAQCHGLSGEALTEEVGALAPGQLAFTFHGTHDVAGTVFDGGETGRQRAGARRVAAGWCGQAEGFVRSLLIVDWSPAIKDPLAVRQVVRLRTSALSVRWKRSSLPWVWG